MLDLFKYDDRLSGEYGLPNYKLLGGTFNLSQFSYTIPDAETVAFDFFVNGHDTQYASLDMVYQEMGMHIVTDGLVDSSGLVEFSLSNGNATHISHTNMVHLPQMQHILSDGLNEGGGMHMFNLQGPETWIIQTPLTIASPNRTIVHNGLIDGNAEVIMQPDAMGNPYLTDGPVGRFILSGIMKWKPFGKHVITKVFIGPTTHVMTTDLATQIANGNPTP